MLLAATLVVALCVTVPLAITLGGTFGALAALAAALIVCVASILGLVLGELFRGPNEALMKLVFGMTVRMSLPLGACMVVCLNGGPLAAAGFVYYVLGFYLVALPIDTLLSVAAVAPKSTN